MSVALGLVRQMWRLMELLQFDPAMVRAHLPAVLSVRRTPPCHGLPSRTSRCGTRRRSCGAEQVGRFAQLVMPVTMAVVQTGLLPRQSTLGLGR